MINVRAALALELNEHYPRLGDRESTQRTALHETLDAFLDAVPEKEISDAAYHLVRSSIHSSLTSCADFPYVLQLTLLTYINSC